MFSVVMRVCDPGEMYACINFLRIIPHCRLGMKTALTVRIILLPLCVWAQETAPRSKAIVGAIVVDLCGDHPVNDAAVMPFET